jgi:transposase InsO family protein
VSIRDQSRAFCERFQVRIPILLAQWRVLDAAWMSQVRRNVTDASDGFLKGKRYLIHDRDPLFISAFRETLASAGVENRQTAAPFPESQWYAERFVRSVKESCLDRLILVGEGSLRKSVREFVEHYHFGRNHQGLDNRLILPGVAPTPGHGRIVFRERLGGLLKYYHRPAA